MNDSLEPLSVNDIYLFLTGTAIDVPNVVIHLDAVEESGYNLEGLFKGNFSVIVYQPHPTEEVGHFLLLSHLGEKTLEWFDSFAQEPPDSIRELARRNGMKLLTNKVQLQDKSTNVCAKWCVGRMMSLPITLKSFVEIYTGHKTLSPDVLINNIFKLKKPHGY